jgi:hypothetical protein
MASRLEALAKRIEKQVLLSRAFADLAQANIRRAALAIRLSFYVSGEGKGVGRIVGAESANGLLLDKMNVVPLCS